MCTSSPSRRNSGCGWTRSVMYRSPVSPPSLPTCPLPGTRMRAPSARPGGTITLSDSVRVALLEDVGEQIAEGRRVGAVHAHRKVEPLEPVRAPCLALGGQPGRVVAPAAIRIAQRLVRFRDPAELRRCHPVAGIDVRMVL